MNTQERLILICGQLRSRDYRGALSTVEEMLPRAKGRRARQLFRLRRCLRRNEHQSAEIIAAGLRATPKRAPPSADQLMLACATFYCQRLHAEEVQAVVCVARQQASEAQRTQQTSRGQGRNYPHCDSLTCQQGREIREALDPDAETPWRGSGKGGRIERDRSEQDKAQQRAARKRQARAGLLEEPSTVDGVTGAVETEGEEG